MTFLVRLSGDLCTKARRTRLRFTKRLVGNLRRALAAVPGDHRIEREWSRILVHTDDPTAGERLATVFGVQSVSRVRTVPWSDLDDLVATARDIFAPSVEGRRFAVRARRSGDRHGITFTSLDVERSLGAALLPSARGVDLTDPDVTASLDVHRDVAYLFTDVIPGPGGLPLGVEGRALALVSGGFDSAVASWMLLKRGAALDYVFFNLGGTSHLVGALTVMKALIARWAWGDRARLHSIDLRPAVAAMQDLVEPRYWQLILKRLMFRAADQLADETGLPALVTGESVGQVSSQTLQNLAVLSEASSRTILRPLVGLNKQEIVACARRIGTYEASAAVDEYCDLLPKRPVTHASSEAVASREAALDPELLAVAVRDRVTFLLREIDPEAMAKPELEASEIEPGTIVLDLRRRDEFDRWHPEGALWLEFSHAVRATGAFDAARRYLLYCEIGLKSAHLAELMQEAGFDAQHVQGGVKTLKQWLEATPLAAAR